MTCSPWKPVSSRCTCSGTARHRKAPGRSGALFSAPLPCRSPARPTRKADARVRTPGDQPGTTALCCQLIETVTVLRFYPNPSIRIHGFTDLWGSGFTPLRIYGNPPLRFSGFVESRRSIYPWGYACGAWHAWAPWAVMRVDGRTRSAFRPSRYQSSPLLPAHSPRLNLA